MHTLLYFIQATVGLNEVRDFAISAKHK